MNNNDTPFTSEFFDKDAKRRKQIPIAVFTIVAAHVVLFVGLLGAAGCKKDPAATSNADADNQAKQFANAEYKSQPVAPESLPATATSSAATAVTPTTAATEAPQYGPLEKIIVTEPEEAVRPIKTVATVAPRNVATNPKVNATAPATSTTSVESDTYIVKSGDSLDKIARKYGTTTKALKTSNNLKSNVIRVGQKLKITNAKARQA